METSTLGCETILVDDLGSNPVSLIWLTCGSLTSLIFLIVAQQNARSECEKVDESNHSYRQGSCSNLEESNGRLVILWILLSKVDDYDIGGTANRSAWTSHDCGHRHWHQKSSNRKISSQTPSFYDQNHQTHKCCVADKRSKNKASDDETKQAKEDRLRVTHDDLEQLVECFGLVETRWDNGDKHNSEYSSVTESIHSLFKSETPSY